jgi:hypothetical protein
LASFFTGISRWKTLATMINMINLLYHHTRDQFHKHFTVVSDYHSNFRAIGFFLKWSN